jgi:hypothetical protein
MVNTVEIAKNERSRKALRIVEEKIFENVPLISANKHEEMIEAQFCSRRHSC